MKVLFGPKHLKDKELTQKLVNQNIEDFNDIKEEGNKLIALSIISL